MIRTETLTFTVGTSVANAAGTFTTNQPICGEVIEVRLSGTSLGGTGIYTITRPADGGTLLLGTLAAPWALYPAPVTTAGTYVAAASTTPGIPVDDYLQLVVTKGVASATGTLHILYRT